MDDRPYRAGCAASCQDSACDWRDTGGELYLTTTGSRHNLRVRHHVIITAPGGGTLYDWPAPADGDQGDEPPY